MNGKEFNTKRQLIRSQSVVKFRKGREHWLIRGGQWERGPGGGDLWWLLLTQAGEAQRPEAGAFFFAACGIVL